MNFNFYTPPVSLARQHKVLILKKTLTFTPCGWISIFILYIIQGLSFFIPFPNNESKWKKVRRSERSDGRWEDPLSSPRRELGIRWWMAITSLHVGQSAAVIKDGASDTMIVREEEVRDNNPWENMNHNDRLCRDDASGCIPFQRGGETE